MSRPCSPSLLPRDKRLLAFPCTPKKRKITDFFEHGTNQLPVDSPSISRARLNKQPLHIPLRDDALLCVDLFCGAGGWSCGARQNGHRVVLAVDCDNKVLQIHRHNHPETRHSNMKLGADTEEALCEMIRTCVPDGARWCLHGSPPCQTLSTIKNIKSSNGLVESEHEGIGLVVWFLQLVNRLRPTYWTFEQVVHPQVIGALRTFQVFCPGLASFNSFNFSDYGLGQTRVRILAGTPVLIENMINNTELRQGAPTLKTVLRATIPDSAVYIKSSCNKYPDPSETLFHTDGSTSNPTQFRRSRTVDQVSYTCVACRPQAFLARDYSLLRRMTTRESATLQSFPSWYYFSPLLNSQTCQTGIGNALPPMITRKLLSCI